MLNRPPLILDCDTLSHLAWGNRVDIVQDLYRGQMIILPEVIEELKRLEFIYRRVEPLITSGDLRLDLLNILEREGEEFNRLYGTGKYGRGEAACMAYARFRQGTLGSNNMRDVKRYCSEFGIPIRGICGILYFSHEKGYISTDEASQLWMHMLSKKRKLPVASYNEVHTAFITGRTSDGRELF